MRTHPCLTANLHRYEMWQLSQTAAGTPLVGAILVTECFRKVDQDTLIFSSAISSRMTRFCGSGA